MKQLRNKLPRNHENIVLGKYTFILIVFFWLGGCGIWNAYLDPDYGSSRADRLCHPYGDCSQGTWVGSDVATQDSTAEKLQCQEAIDQRYTSWWDDSVSRGLEIGRCMEGKGYSLQQ